MFIVVYITAGNADEAKKIAYALVSNNLAACVNMHPINSVYVWGGKVEYDSEIAMFIKTTSDKFDEISDMVHSIHSYDLPCVISWEIKGDEDYLDWISGRVHKSD
ncbi:MAG: divalent-cation tolerance protein CutA [Methanosarcinaceae archaeon]|nr:divalent-cation tolerance protein CutA [Methanosarcinaceae archaeon]